MTTNKLIVLSFLISLPITLLGQSFKGTVSDAVNAKPLPYASIGVKAKSIGGIADADGRFDIAISKAAPTDTIIVSYLGYASVKIIKREISQSAYQIKLSPGALQLHEVIAQGKREIIPIGNQKASGQYTGWGDYKSSRGRLRGVAIETNELPLKLAKFKMHMDACEFDSVRFRLHILPLAGGYSGNLKAELINENIFFNVNKGQKWVSVDLAPYNLVIDENIVVAVEWLDAWVKEEERDESYKLTISLSRKEGYMFIRNTPQEPFLPTKSKFSPTMYFETYKSGNGGVE
ncbi:carboxypeptidase-like regulatory domain-containing protein [Dyadobacter chenhuakuii]|uniref:Carboxypeptidase-like regulatory domain-containing protein n=1 Tax=Dyadobacter chenhuakuii TaxID=2909339 RepID=A0A9X1QGU3_9BACT|nr:carboxypeptidase-like regulatory domain-containing protein [Dyadobacter chenhuakuii]MCF2501271.1 carboxypeptidase-like regulatory domain-containing protein [Dyadobacter chenhuakuii]